MTSEIEEKFKQAEEDVLSPHHGRSQIFKEIFDLAERAGDVKVRERARHEVLLWDLDATAPREKRSRFQPLMGAKRQDGADWFYPDPDRFTSEAFFYYKSSLAQTKNPIRQARYGDFLWEKQPSVNGKRNFHAAAAAVEGYLKASDIYIERIAGATDGKQDNYTPLDMVDAITRACQLSAQIQDGGMLKRSVACAVATLGKLVEMKRPRWTLEIVEGLLAVKSLESYCDVSLLWAPLDAGAQFYRSERDGYHLERAFLKAQLNLAKRQGDTAKVRNLEIETGEVYLREAEWKRANYPSGNMVAAHIYQEAHDHFSRIGESSRLGPIKIKIKELWRAAIPEFKRVEFPLEIPVAEIESFFSTYRKAEPGITAEGFLDILGIHPNLRPTLKWAMEQAESQTKNHFSSLLSRQVVSGDNPVYKPKNEQEQAEYLVLENFRRLYIVAGLHISLYLKYLREREDLTPRRFTKYLVSKPFLSRKSGIIRQAIEHWFTEDHLSFTHLIVPHIEDILRSFLVPLNEPTTVPRESGFTEIGLNGILSRPKLQDVFGEDLMQYFRLLLADVRGDNLRNKVAHGLIDTSECTAEKSALLLHILLILGTYTMKSEDPQGSFQEGA